MSDFARWDYDSIMQSKKSTNDKIKALNDLKKDIKKYRLREVKYYSGVTLLGALASGGLLYIDHEMFDAFIGKNTNVEAISNANIAMFWTELVAAGISILGVFSILETVEYYIQDTIEVNSYQKRLKPHK